MIYIAFLWHNHQPVYREDIQSSKNETIHYSLPWVRLHATKDYYDTVAILDEFPAIKLNFNLVPSLLMQLDEYAKGAATDRYLELTLKNASEFSEEEKIFILQNFFTANWKTMINKYKRYNELLNKRGRHTSYDELNRIQTYFKEQDIRDLQVWFNLSWFDPYWQRTNEFIKELFAKSEKFSEDEKLQLIKIQTEICGKIVGKYKSKQDSGQIEISTTPFYHPILPLLCNTDIAKIAMPNVVLPDKKFSHPEDARTQISRSVGYYEKLFGRKPRGMWPSEGSVSEDIVPLIADAGINWIATDEDILFNTLKKYQSNIPHPRHILYQPYLIKKGDKTLNIIFRDKALSDAIGFVYNTWDPKHAVDDFMGHIHRIHDACSEGNCLVPIILDGENCWEYYNNDGWDFLRELYSRISNDPLVKTTTISEYLTQNPPEIHLNHLWPGSWINGNYGVWIGHPEDNLAWDYLSNTRNFLIEYVKTHPEKKDSQEVISAFDEIYIAEGSDWCWWYGGDHSSLLDEEFDKLYRKHLINVYSLLGEKIPDELYVAIKGKIKKKFVIEPVDFIHPVIDGKLTNYFEWLAAGSYQIGHRGGTMHQVETILSSFHYGFDLENFHLRIDVNLPESDQNNSNLEQFDFKILFLQPKDTQIIFKFESDMNVKEFYLLKGTQRKDLSTISAKKIIELSIPFDELGIKINEQVEFVIVIEKEPYKSEIERWPYQDTVRFSRPTKEFSAKDWTAL